MSSGAVRLRFDHVTKKFKKGEWTKTLRDLIPSLAKQVVRPKKSASLTLDQGEFYSLKDVSFEARAGECLGIIGPNGAGKSTTLKLASKILKPNEGKITVNGRVCALIEVGAGFHPDLTGRENVFLNGAILGMKKADITKRFDEIVAFAGLDEFIDTPVKRYSSGMYARLGFSVAAHMDPDLLLLDEVLSVGDMAFGHKCQRKIKQILASDAAVVFISHSLPAVRSLCDRVIVLDGGGVVYEGDADTAIHHYHNILNRGGVGSADHPAIRNLAMRLVDREGNPCLASRPGEAVELEMSLVADRRIAETSLGFFVCNEQDVEIYGTTMDELGDDAIDMEPGDQLQVRFALDTNLVPGTYWIGSIVFGKPERDSTGGRLTLDRHPNRVQWSVTGSVQATGSANLFASSDILFHRERESPSTREQAISNG